MELATDRGFPIAAGPFARQGDGWTLRIPAPPLDRFEYALAVQRADGAHERWTDPANPLRAPGAFGEKSVVELPGYAAPAWLGAERVAGRADSLTVASSALGAELHVAIWRPEDARDDERAGPARRARRPRARPARTVDRLLRRSHRLGRAATPPRSARRPRRSRPVVLGERPVRPRAGHPRAARDRRCGRGAQCGGRGGQPRSARHAARPASLPRRLRRTLPAVGQLLHAALRRAGVGLRALPADRALRPLDPARAAAPDGAGGA